MKTSLLKNALTGLILLANLFALHIAQAQQIPNNSFEDWSILSFFENPAGYNTTNFQSYLALGTSNVTKTTDAHSGSFAAKLETMGTAPDLIPGGIFLGQLGGGGLAGGIPYTQRPDSVRFYTKYDLLAGDSAMIVLMFQFQSNPIGYAVVNLGGTQSTYTAITAEVGWFVQFIMPDTVAFIVFSSSPGIGSTPGSVFYLDDITLLGATQQLPNNGFENWLDVSAESPDHWNTSNPYTIMGSGLSVSKSSDHIDGLYSMKVTNEMGPQGDTISYATNGNLGGNGPAGGTPISQNPAKLTFYYKYQPVGMDTALAMSILWRWDQASGTRFLVDSVMVKLAPQSSWTYYEIPYYYTGSPHADTVTVAFAGGNMNETGSGVGLGSSLWVDNVNLDYGPIGINDPSDQSFSIYPNPASNTLNVKGEAKTVRIEILSVDGKLLKSMEIIPGTKTDISDLQPGCYLYHIIKGPSIISGKFIKI